MPYKAREALAKLQRAGFIVKRQSGSHVVLSTRMGVKLKSVCIRAACQATHSALCLSKPAFPNNS